MYIQDFYSVAGCTHDFIQYFHLHFDPVLSKHEVRCGYQHSSDLLVSALNVQDLGAFQILQSCLTCPRSCYQCIIQSVHCYW